MNRHLALVLSAALVLACGDDGDPSADGSTSGGVTVGGDEGGAGASISSTAGSGGSGGATSSSSSGGGGEAGVPCTPLAELDAVDPTPGACEGNVAVTCGQDGFLVHDACRADETCQIYDLQEWRIAPSAEWIEGRVIQWAGCVQTDAPECTLAWNGSYYETEMPYCEGVDRVSCRLPPAPVVNSVPQTTYGTEQSSIFRESCGQGEVCAGSNTLGQLTCIDEATPPCDGTEPFCNAAAAVHCYGTWESLPGYRAEEPCNVAGDVCYEGTLEGNPYPYCDAPGEVACDPSTFVRQCESGTAIVDCGYGFTTHFDCSMCYLENQLVPCRCDVELGSGCDDIAQPTCVPNAKPECDPAVDTDYCAGGVAYRCIGHWEPYDCAAEGLECGVGGGVAGCREAGAPACTSSNQTCDGTEIVGCCDCSGDMFLLFGPPSQPPCVPGFEARRDCADLGLTYHCEAGLGSLVECEL